MTKPLSILVGALGVLLVVTAVSNAFHSYRQCQEIAVEINCVESQIQRAREINEDLKFRLKNMDSDPYVAEQILTERGRFSPAEHILK